MSTGDSGEVRTSGVQRRGDPMQNGDGIFNSLDDQLYNSLNPGNDGIFGTMDDFYSTTPYGDVAASAQQVPMRTIIVICWTRPTI